MSFPKVCYFDYNLHKKITEVEYFLFVHNDALKICNDMFGNLQ